MPIEKWLSDIDHEIQTLTEARNLLAGRRPPKTAPAKTKTQRKPFSASARRKMSAAMKRRWREARKAGRTALAA